jgi:hypothetical protein
LVHDGQVLTKFLGESPEDPTNIDGRRIRATGADPDNYKAWVHYWRETALRQRFEKLKARRSDDNYFVEPAGRVLAGEVVDPQTFLADLYQQLVAPPDGSEAPRQERQERPFEKIFAAVADQFETVPDYTIDINDDHLRFDYGVRSKELFLFRTLSLNGNREKTWDAVHTAIYAVAAAREAAQRAFAVVAETDPGPDGPKQMRQLERQLKAGVVKVNADGGHSALLDIVSSKLLLTGI